MNPIELPPRALLVLLDRATGGRRTVAFDSAFSNESGGLLKALFAAGCFHGQPLCAGQGRCGGCRVRFLPESASAPPQAEPVERDVLGAEAVAQGWRLACRHPARSGDAVEVPARPSRRTALAPGQLDIAPDRPLGLAVDLGTTSIHWALVDSVSAAVVATGAEPNPQMGVGGDVLSRLAFAATPERRELLAAAVFEGLAAIVREARESGLGQVERMAVAGNPAMTHILTGADVSGLSRAPWKLSETGGREAAPPEKFAADLPSTYLPPQFAPFVGGDVSAGLAWLLEQPGVKTPFVLADLGTNGEFVLATPDGPGGTLRVASAPMGPALEGMGMRCGTLAGPGVAVRFQAGPAGLEVERLPGQPVPKLSGTGYLSLLAVLRNAGLLDEAGGFRPPETPLARRLFGPAPFNAGDAGETSLGLPGGARLYASDVETFLKVKAAFSAVLAALLADAGLTFADLSKVYLAGALGEHARPDDLEALGFVPPGGAARTLPIGNASLKGAVRCLLDAAFRARLEGLSGRVAALDPAADPDFMRQYVSRMVFRYVP